MNSLLFKIKYCSVFYIVLIFNISLGQQLPDNPCPNYFSYRLDGSQYVGVIEIPEPTDASSAKLDIVMTIGATLRSDYIGELRFVEYAFNQRNEPTMVYHMHFPSGPTPKLKQLVVNDREICTGSRVQAFSVTTISHQSTRSTRSRGHGHSRILSNSDLGSQFIPVNDFNERVPNPTIRQPSFPPPFVRYTTYRPIFEEDDSFVQNFPIQSSTQQSINFNQNNRQPDQCGVVAPRFQSTPLIFHGEDIDHGSWPWLAAIYSYSADTRRFICGGSLVSRRAVLTAAHCFDTRSGSRIEPSNCMIELGRHNRGLIREPEMREQIVSQIIVHTDYKSDRSNGFDADIAIVLMQTLADITEYIRPICLPNQGNRDLNGPQGTVVGWGRNEYGQFAPTPKKSAQPIVSQNECVQSNERFQSLVSRRTFCAGDRTGSGPCHGDSGGGFAIQINGRWTLVGIVSASLTSTVGNCDLSNFVIYADVSQFADWIESNR